MDRFKSALDFSIKQAERFPFIREIWLYGSYARNENSPQSDVDLFVVTENSLNGKDKIRIKNALCSDNFRLPETDIHFGVYQKQDTASAAEKLFLKNIEKDGKLVYKSDSK